MHEVFPPYRAMLGTGVAIEPRVPKTVLARSLHSVTNLRILPVATDWKVDQQNTTSPTRKKVPSSAFAAGKSPMSAVSRRR